MSRVEEIRTLLDAATPGPWRWGGNVDGHFVYLGTVHSGRVMVMTFERWGMQGAGPAFWQRNREPGTPAFWGGKQMRIKECAVREVPYRGDIDHIDNPDAELIARAPEHIAFLLGEVERLTRERDEAREAYDDLSRMGRPSEKDVYNAWQAGREGRS